MENNEKQKVLLISSEVNPFAKSGGLGDVIGSLPKELVNHGLDARVVLPKYKTIKPQWTAEMQYIDTMVVKQSWKEESASIYLLDGEVKTYFIENDYYFGRDGFYGYGDDFERFAFFSEAVLCLLNKIDFQPQILHLNDWQTGLVSVYLKDRYRQFLFYKEMKTLYTIHNLQYQGVFGREILYNINLNDGYFTPDKLEYYGNVNYMKAGLLYSDMISTVSETYAQEIQTSSYGYGLDGVLRQRQDHLVGILNGIDTSVNNPQTDPFIYCNYDLHTLDNKAENKWRLQEELHLPKRDIPVIGIISRLVDQKGMDLIQNILEDLMQWDIQLVVLGTGDGRYEHLFKHYEYRFPEKLSANIFFGNELAQKIYAGADMFLMPSLFEPCGLGQMFAMRYGTIPIARKTGGLSDTIQHYDSQTKEGTGFLFEDYLPSGLWWAIDQAVKTFYNKSDWQQLVKNAMEKDFSWSVSAQKYMELYDKMMQF